MSALLNSRQNDEIAIQDCECAEQIYSRRFKKNLAKIKTKQKKLLLWNKLVFKKSKWIYFSQTSSSV